MQVYVKTARVVYVGISFNISYDNMFYKENKWLKESAVEGSTIILDYPKQNCTKSPTLQIFQIAKHRRKPAFLLYH